MKKAMVIRGMMGYDNLGTIQVKINIPILYN